MGWAHPLPQPLRHVAELHLGTHTEVLGDGKGERAPQLVAGHDELLGGKHICRASSTAVRVLKRPAAV
jgi:hypothetical protein